MPIIEYRRKSREVFSVARGTNQKFKFSYLMQIMQEKTDEEHAITMPQIMEELEKYEVTAERKSIYADFRDMTDKGDRTKGRKKTLDKSVENSKILPLEESSVDTSVEHVKELEDELLKLKIENAFLKELRRLRLEDEAKMRERQESSTVSEDSSN